MIDDNDKKFFDEYAALVRKYERGIGSCGCCNSPWVFRIFDQHDGTVEEHLNHIERSMEELT